MTVKEEITWFKEQFAANIVPALAGTPLSFDLICAIAFQESGELWSKLRLHLPREEVLRLSVGDTLDEPSRSAFPKNKDALTAAPNGQPMFDLAHRLLVQMGDATGIEAYQRLGRSPDKFVHGYGIFQYDLQFFRGEPDFFLDQRWKNFDVCLDKAMRELKGLSTARLRQQDVADRPGIGLRCDRLQHGLSQFQGKQGLQQGHFDGTHFYGENIDGFCRSHGQSRRHASRPRRAGLPPAPRGAGPSIVAIAKAEFVRSTASTKATSLCEAVSPTTTKPVVAAVTWIPR